ncbi:MAG TPA: nucleoside monophosphate kinase [Tenericutes bacterium]|nr:nucleoside monophosphate kinase [Mycoplasmatota bacterium]
MNLIIIGPPASGKGTNATKISEKYNIPHISIGQLLRNILESDSPYIAEIKSAMEKGEIVRDEIIKEIIEKRLAEEDAKKGFIIDGFPRNLTQIDILFEILEKHKRNLDGVIFIDLDKEELIKRTLTRLVCSNCGKNFSKEYYLEKTCDNCGEMLTVRTDDQNFQTIETRYNNYLEYSLPVIKFFKTQGLLYEIDGNQDMEKVYNDIETLLENLGEKYDNNKKS